MCVQVGHFDRVVMAQRDFIIPQSESITPEIRMKTQEQRVGALIKLMLVAMLSAIPKSCDQVTRSITIEGATDVGSCDATLTFDASAVAVAIGIAPKSQKRGKRP